MLRFRSVSGCVLCVGSGRDYRLRRLGVAGFALIALAALVAPVAAAHAAPPHKASAPPQPPSRVGNASSPASREPAITTAGPNGDYLRALHRRLHDRWTEDFMKTVSATHPAEHPLNTPTRQVSIAISIRWDGSAAERTITRSSGAPEFDRAALDIVRKSAPFPLPPIDVISDDSFAHVEWTFARDHRACAAGAQLIRVDDPLALSLPRLIASNRFGEALRRIVQAGQAGEGANDNGSGMDRFARLYLGRTFADPVLDVAAAVALAESGDKTQAPRLRAALASRSTADLAARGLRKLGIDVCEAVRETLGAGTAAAREIAIGAMRSVATSGGDISGCHQSLAGIVADAGQPAALRLNALETMVTFVPAATARPVVMATIEDKDPAVRGAALLASVRKGAGRPEMYRLAPLLHDKRVEVRGAASAGMIRAGGDLALEQLYLLGRETDPRPGTWVAAELAQMSTRASAEFLGKMLKKNNPPVQLAAARALVARKDPGARTELDAARTDDRLPRDVRAVAAGEVSPAAPVPGSGAHAPTIQTGAQAAAAASEPVRQLLKKNQNNEAAAWIAERLLSLEPRATIDVLAAWLVRQPQTAASSGQPPVKIPPSGTGTPASAPAMSAPGAAAPVPAISPRPAASATPASTPPAGSPATANALAL